MEDEVAEVLKQLRKSQNALKKAIDRKYQDLQCTAQPLIVSAPVSLSTDEVQTLAEEVKYETTHDYEPVNDHVSDSNPSSPIGSPEIPVLSGLDRLFKKAPKDI